MTHVVFVYGTLKQGQPNHRLMTESQEGTSRLIGQAHTQSKWPLVIASQHNIPYLLEIEGEGYNVVGEVYEVNDVLFAELDELEGYPGYYDRKQIDVKMEKTAAGTECNDIRKCWVYVLPDYKPSMVDLERYENYDSYGAHGKPYMCKYEREEGWGENVYTVVLGGK